MSKQSEFFDSYAERWDSLERADIRERLERVVRASAIAPGMRVLDVGCGTGVLIPSLLAALGGSGEICAIDISPEMLKMAREKGFPPSVSFELADIETFQPSGGDFDRVMCNAVFPHFTDKLQALRAIHGLLRPGGLLVISHPTGRAAVNKVHAEAGPTVAEDRVPGAAEMQALLDAAGFVDTAVLDEPEFYLASGRKPIGG